MRAIRSAAAVALALCSSGVTWHGIAQAQAPTRQIYEFPSFIGRSPDLTADAAGTLYGVTLVGGIDGCGTIYRLVSPAAKGQPWMEETLSILSRAGSGCHSSSKPLLDAAGSIYGTSPSGGTTSDGQIGNGTVWRLSPPTVTGNPWVLTVLYTFSHASAGVGGLDGGAPVGGLAMDRSGTLYGLAERGGSAGGGVVFSLAPPGAGSTTWKPQVLHDFTGHNDTLQPTQPLMLSADGTTLSGVADTWFNGSGHQRAGGAIYRLRREVGGWSYHLLYLFRDVPPGNGNRPVGKLLEDRTGNLFGVTRRGGASGNDGTVYELTPPALGRPSWTEQVLHSFATLDGRHPVAGLVAGGSPVALFGTTLRGGEGGAVDGSSGSFGVVFRLDPPVSGTGPWAYSELHAFDIDGPHNEAGSIGNGLTFGKNHFLFGIASRGGLYSRGAVFAQSPHLP